MIYTLPNVNCKNMKKIQLAVGIFYDCYQAGLVEDDGSNSDIHAWAGIFEIKSDLERRYKKLIFRQKSFGESVKSLSTHGMVAG
jgi:hypothetical protein